MFPAPQLAQRSPPVLVDDAMREIFLRVPPDDPATLARASAVCTAWRGIISDADFGREYRAFHGAPPVLGFLYNYCHFPYTSHFVSTTTSLRSPACHDRQDWYALDSRHGLVLFHTRHYSPGEDIRDFVVCDLVAHDQWRVPPPPSPEWSEVIYWNAAVLCARVDTCDHRDCDEGAFLLALVGSNYTVILASVYSSEAGEWSDTISIEKWNTCAQVDEAGHSAVVGNKVYLPYGEKSMVVEYNLGAQELAVVRVPFVSKWGSVLDPRPGTVLVGVEDGMLLYAATEESTLYLWSMEPGPNGAGRRRVIDLEPLLPPLALCSIVSVVGFAEGAGVIFLETDEGLFTVELSSCRSKKVQEGLLSHKLIPYMIFYTGGHGDRGKRAVVGATRRGTGLLWLYGENLQ